jgi:hypothetical protein
VGSSDMVRGEEKNEKERKRERERERERDETMSVEVLEFIIDILHILKLVLEREREKLVSSVSE